MSTAEAMNPMGLKRICTNCGVRFYDMNNRPISCPSCDTEFTGEVKVKSKRGRVAAADKKEDPLKAAGKAAVVEEEALEEEEDSGVEVVSLEDAEEPAKDKESTISDEANDESDDIAEFDVPVVDDLDTDDDTLLDAEDDD